MTRRSPRSSAVQARIRGQRFHNAARLLALIELTRRLHQAYEQAYDKQAADWLLPQNPTQLTGRQVDNLASNLQKFLDDPECGKFIKAMSGSLPNDVWKTSKSRGLLMDNFTRIKNLGGFWSGDTMSKKALAHELTHIFTNAPNAGLYGHLQMAQAASAAATSLGLNLKRALMPNFPTTQQYGTGEAYDLALSEYFNRTLSYACRKVKL